MLQAAKKNTNSDIAYAQDDQHVTTGDLATAYQEETKTSVLVFDHHNILATTT